MNIKEIDCDQVSEIVNLILPEGLIKKNLIISGGFASWLLYLKIKEQESPDIFRSVKESIANRVKASKLIYATNTYELSSETVFALPAVLKYSDIDIWIPSGNAIAKDDFFAIKYDIKELAQDHVRYIETDYFEPDYRQDGKPNLRLMYFIAEAVEFFLSSFDCNSSLSKVNLEKVSDYAYSFNCLNSISQNNLAIAGFYSKIQIMREPINSLESLFELFDMDHVKVAYYNGKLYFAEEAERSFLDGLISKTDNFTNKSEALTIKSAIRAFKYADRFDMSFSDELALLVLELFVKYGTHEALIGSNIDLGVSNTLNLSTGAISVDGFADEYCTYFLNMNADQMAQVKVYYIREFLRNSHKFISMKCFTDEFIPYLALCETFGTLINNLIYELTPESNFEQPT